MPFCSRTGSDCPNVVALNWKSAQILMHHIRDCLPEIKSKLNAMMQNVSQELVELGEPTDCVSAASLGATLVSEDKNNNVTL